MKTMKNTSKRRKTYLLIANSNWDNVPIQVAGPFFENEIAQAQATFRQHTPELTYQAILEDTFAEEQKSIYLESWYSRPEYYISTFLDSHDDVLERCRVSGSVIYGREIYLNINKARKECKIAISTTANARIIGYLIGELKDYLQGKLTIIIQEEEYYLSQDNFFFSGENARMAHMFKEIYQN